MKNVKLNNKGFMLVEVIIVTVVVATIMTSLYVLFNRVYNNYELKETYTNVDAIYALKTIEDFLIDEMKLNAWLKGNTREIKCDDMSDVNYCNNIFSQYNINRVFFVKLSDSSNEVPSLPNDVNQTFKDYITYLNNAITFGDDTNYILVTETYENSSDKNILNKYAYLEIK